MSIEAERRPTLASYPARGANRIIYHRSELMVIIERLSGENGGQSANLKIT